MKITRLFAALFAGILWSTMALAQFNLLHEFAGSPNDGAAPWWDSSVVAGGTTLYGMTANGGPTTNGVLFKVNTTGSGFQVLHNFTGYVPGLNPTGSKDNGATPYGTPVLAGSVLYGMTALGGSNGFGTVWRMNTDGNGFQILHHFGASLDGYNPNGSLVLDGTTLYGTTQNGGSNSSIGVVFKIETNGTAYQILRHFDVSNSGPLTPFGTPLVTNGLIFGTTRLGGTQNNGAVYSLDTNGGNFQVLHNFTGISTDGSHPQGPLLLDGTTLIGTTVDGGANNVGTIFHIQTNGSGFQIKHDFALSEAYHPYGGFTRSNTTLYAFTKDGVTNGLGGGAIIQIDTDGSNYRQIYTFRFPIQDPDGQWPYGTPLLIGTKLYGLTQTGGTLLGGHQGTVFSFDLTGNGGGGGGGSDPVHDMAVTGLKAPKKATLQEGQSPKPGKLSISIQNTGDFTETIPNSTALQNLVNLQIESLGLCTEPDVTLVSPTTFPVVLEPNKKLKIALLVTITCANDPATGIGHEDYRYTVTLDLNSLAGQTDNQPANNLCPRPASGSDKGCAKGATVFTDVAVK